MYDLNIAPAGLFLTKYPKIACNVYSTSKLIASIKRGPSSKYSAFSSQAGVNQDPSG